jgi:hypothetical protein
MTLVGTPASVAPAAFNRATLASGGHRIDDANAGPEA